MEYKFFAGIRVKGEFTSRGFYSKENTDFVDINISKEEAERLVKFLSLCLEKENANS